MTIILVLLGVCIGGLFLGYLFLDFMDRNSEEPEVRRKWSDPSHRDDKIE